MQKRGIASRDQRPQTNMSLPWSFLLIKSKNNLDDQYNRDVIIRCSLTNTTGKWLFGAPRVPPRAPRSLPPQIHVESIHLVWTPHECVVVEDLGASGDMTVLQVIISYTGHCMADAGMRMLWRPGFKINVYFLIKENTSINELHETWNNAQLDY